MQNVLKAYMFVFSNLGAGQACPGEHCDDDIHHHEMDPLSSVVPGDNDLQQRPQPVLGVRSEDLRKINSKDSI